MIEAALQGLGHLEVTRVGNTVVARTDLGRSERVVLAGHIDTEPDDPGEPARPRGRRRRRSRDRGHEGRGGGGGLLSGTRVLTRPPTATSLPWDRRGEEASTRSSTGSGCVAAGSGPDLLRGRLRGPASSRPTAGVEGGCRARWCGSELTGPASRPTPPAPGWDGRHPPGRPILHAARRLTRRPPSTWTAWDYREALQATGIPGGIAGNVIPDRCVMTVQTGSRRTSPRPRPRQCLRALLAAMPRTGGRCRRRRTGPTRPARRGVVRSAAVSGVADQDRLDRRRPVRRHGDPGGRLRSRPPDKAYADDEFCPGRPGGGLPRRPGALARLDAPGPENRLPQWNDP